MWAVTVTGTPAPKGSLKCVGQKGRHQLIEDDSTGRGKPWRRLLTEAGEAIAQRSGDAMRTGPVSVEVCFTLDRPASAPRRIWPTTRSGGDVDKLSRMLLDALTDSRVIGDDSQVVQLTAWKTHPNNPDVPDSLPAAGARIRLWKTDT